MKQFQEYAQGKTNQTGSENRDNDGSIPQLYVPFPLPVGSRLSVFFFFFRLHASASQARRWKSVHAKRRVLKKILYVFLFAGVLSPLCCRRGDRSSWVLFFVRMLSSVMFYLPAEAPTSEVRRLCVLQLVYVKRFIVCAVSI